MKLSDKLPLIAQREVNNEIGNYFQSFKLIYLKGILLLRVRDELKMTIAAY